MENIERLKVANIIEELKCYILPDDKVLAINPFIVMQNLFSSATREIVTKLENLNDEFKYVKDRNPIHHIKSRIKTPKSIMDKLGKRGYELSAESAKENLNDIGGIRVICSNLDDIYMIANLLTSQNDVGLIRTTDYILNPKQNGYRSLHLIVTVPVFLSASSELVKVEIQIRTIAMDFWASLEHELSYKLPKDKIEAVTQELKECANIISDIDIRMQHLYSITTLSKNTMK